MATLAGTVPTGYGGGRAQVLLDWLTTVDHKKIGIMYVVAAGVFGLVGGALSLVVRTELIETGAIMGADTYNQMFTMHASIMLFLFIMRWRRASRTMSCRCKSARWTWPSRASTRSPCGSSSSAAS